VLSLEFFVAVNFIVLGYISSVVDFFLVELVLLFNAGILPLTSSLLIVSSI
jgi:hypothetical protein